jgi:uncharacterized protein
VSGGAVPWRRWNNVLHRDIGYLCVGLTLVYVVSGVAVNHIGDWNPSYAVERREVPVGLPADLAAGADGSVRTTLVRLGLEPRYRTTFRTDSATLRVFVADGIVDLHLRTGRATVEVVRRRPVFQAVNFLHLNHPKKLWTWVADLYAAALGALAVTGLFMLKGRTGITGRGAWLTASGVAVPLVFLWLYNVA